MKLSVIIVNYNVRHFLELCLQSVQAALTTINSEIIVVDNHSSDESCLMLQKLFPEIILVANTDNVGFSKANNQGVALAKGTHLCILNPDTVVAEDTFVKLLSFSETTNNVGAIGCRLIDGSGRFLPESKRNVPSPKVALQKIVGRDQAYYATTIKTNEIGKASILVGAFMFMKTEIYRESGGFDERYFMYGEDIDLSYSIENLGYDNYYYGHTTILHFKGESTLKDKVYAARFYGAMKLFYDKYFSSNRFMTFLVTLGIRLLPMVKYFQTETKATNKPTITLSCNQFSFKDIIEVLEKQNNHYNIQPKNALFAVGSRSANHRGVVVEVV